MELKLFLIAHRKQAILAGTVLLIVVAGSIAGAIAYNNELDRLATVAAAEAEAKAAEEAEVARLENLAQDLVDARAEGADLVGSARAKQEESAAFADPAVLEGLTEAITQLEADLDSDDLATIKKSISSVKRAANNLGTVDDAQDRKYIEARKAAGKSVEDAAVSIRIGRGVCDDLDPHYAADPASAVFNFVENRANLDTEAITFFCPEYSPAVVAASTSFDDGKHIVSTAPSPMGTYGSDIQQGTYRSPTKTSDCYWERTNGGGSTLANDFVSFAADGITVTIYAGEGFVTEGCGTWSRQ